MILATATVTVVAPLVFATAAEDLDDATVTDGSSTVEDDEAGLRVGASSVSSGNGDRKALEIVICILSEIWQGLRRHAISIFNKIWLSPTARDLLLRASSMSPVTPSHI
ncbi:hypothetical protein TIFTF001_020844 [Ficus carica]|uniref:Secreted protein n=1 Tax=Ficus carica TaxID=3494 RepID=A0AA88DBC9_FICCA|nr:hypothetical protein TIFTF001_020844 [Ficus carica]